jgi:Tol biopolymer transport system component
VQGAFPGQNGKIAFSGCCYGAGGGSQDILIMNANGASQHDLTDQPLNDFEPTWSADATKIAFTSDRDGNLEVYSMNADGSGQTRLTSNTYPVFDGQPSWSPEGRRIAFASDRNGNAEIYVMDADGLNQVNVTNAAASDAQPSWSPNGDRIAFVSDRDDYRGEIYTMNVDGTGLSRLTVDSVPERNPDWSPDGAKLVFESVHDGSNPEIHSMSANGTGETRLTDDPGQDLEPAWSPDGTRIAFGSDRASTNHNLDVYSMNSNGSAQTRLTNNAGFDGQPSWQPIVSTGGYPRPQAAATLRVPLVVAYTQCEVASADETHGAPLTAPSCNPGLPTSSWLTLGTQDANGFLSQSAGFAKVTVCASGTSATGICSAPGGMTVPDVRLEARVTDVRCQLGGAAQSSCEGGAYSDYLGQLEERLTIRITDRHNSKTAGGTGDPATTDAIAFPVTVGCAANPAGGSSAAIGGTCAVLTSANTVVPGAVLAGKRAIWELDQLVLHDGGQDGLASTVGNTLFERQGTFIP